MARSSRALQKLVNRKSERVVCNIDRSWHWALAARTFRPAARRRTARKKEERRGNGQGEANAHGVLVV